MIYIINSSKTFELEVGIKLLKSFESTLRYHQTKHPNINILIFLSYLDTYGTYHRPKPTGPGLNSRQFKANDYNRGTNKKPGHVRLYIICYGDKKVWTLTNQVVKMFEKRGLKYWRRSLQGTEVLQNILYKREIGNTKLMDGRGSAVEWTNQTLKLSRNILQEPQLVKEGED